MAWRAAAIARAALRDDEALARRRHADEVWRARSDALQLRALRALLAEEASQARGMLAAVGLPEPDPGPWHVSACAEESS